MARIESWAWSIGLAMKRETDKVKLKRKRQSPRKPPPDFDERAVKIQHIIKIMEKFIMRNQKLTRSEQAALSWFMKRGIRLRKHG
jgi:hypothetical protein